MNTPKPRLTPAQESLLRYLNGCNYDKVPCTYKPAIKLVELGLIEDFETEAHLKVRRWRITAAGRAWLAARERGNGIKD